MSAASVPQWSIDQHIVERRIHLAAGYSWSASPAPGAGRTPVCQGELCTHTNASRLRSTLTYYLLPHYDDDYDRSSSSSSSSGGARTSRQPQVICRSLKSWGRSSGAYCIRQRSKGVRSFRGQKSPNQVAGCTFSSKKVDDIFSRRPE